MSSSSSATPTSSWAWWKYTSSSSTFTPWNHWFNNRWDANQESWWSSPSSSTPDYYRNWQERDSTTPWSWGHHGGHWWMTSTYFPEWTDYPGWYWDYYVWDWNSPNDCLWYIERFNFTGVSMSILQVRSRFSRGTSSIGKSHILLYFVFL